MLNAVVNLEEILLNVPFICGCIVLSCTRSNYFIPLSDDLFFPSGLGVLSFFLFSRELCSFRPPWRLPHLGKEKRKDRLGQAWAAEEAKAAKTHHQAWLAQGSSSPLTLGWSALASSCSLMQDTQDTGRSDNCSPPPLVMPPSPQPGLMTDTL